MSTFITNVIPDQPSIPSGVPVNFEITIFANAATNNCLIQFSNTKKQVADLDKNGTVGDVVYSNPINLMKGKNDVFESVTFVLDASSSTTGAVITMNIHVCDQNKNVISDVYPVVVSIGAL